MVEDIGSSAKGPIPTAEPQTAVVDSLIDCLRSYGGRDEPAQQAANEIERQRDKIAGLTDDLRMAVQTAYRRGAKEWARLNYPQWIDWLESCEAAAQQTEGPVVAGSMLDRASKAVWEARETRFPGFTQLAWEKGSDLARAEVIVLARAALEAIREPSEAVREAGIEARRNDPYNVNPWPVWSAMIDAILEGKA